jgi:hypothetical protein
VLKEALHGMKTRDFLYSLPELVRQQLPPDLKDFEVAGPTFSLIKLHYGDRDMHYEVWLQRRQGLAEVGLHFEGSDDSNRRYLERMRRHLVEVHSALGPQVEAEQWTESWTRVHQSIPLQPLTDDFLFEIAFVLSQMIRTLEPLVREEIRGNRGQG